MTKEENSTDQLAQIRERYLKNWSVDLNSEMWTGENMIQFAATIRAETLMWLPKDKRFTVVIFERTVAF